MRAFALALALLFAAPALDAEMWPSLEEYVRRCALIARAKWVAGHGNARVFELTEIWVQSSEVIPSDVDQNYVCYEGEHGVDTSKSPEVIFFFTEFKRADKGPPVRHSTAFMIRDNKILYGATSDEPAEYEVEEFKKKVLEIRAAAEKE